MSQIDKILIFIPTYNERENVVKLAEEILALELASDILFIDDNSPDGTGEILDDLAARCSRISVMHRSGKLGIGSAHRDGLAYAYDNGYTACISMDCDFTHPPAVIPRLINESANFDIVITSRYLQKGSLSDWNLFRKILTKLGHLLTTRLLGMEYDATGAFRLYRLDRIPRSFLDLVSSKSYSFFFESLFILNFNKYRIFEVPITLPARTYGHSKMRFTDAWFSFKFLVIIFLNTLINKEKFVIALPLFTASDEMERNDEWEAYWKGQKSDGGLLYEIIAVFFRKFIIKPALNHFIRKYFKPGSDILHAGCGGGQVDTDICNEYQVTGLDISVNALNIYNTVNQGRAKLIRGSIFSLPFAAASFDGVYNLGVMEHFSREEIAAILKDFRRVVRPGGKFVLFWPPEYGISVIFFKVLKRLLRPFYGRDVKFHPDEPSRVRSREDLASMVGDSFLVDEYYFGIRALGTYAVCVLSPK